MSLNNLFGIPKGTGIPRSAVYYNAQSSTIAIASGNTCIVNFTSPVTTASQNIGVDFTVLPSATLGAVFQIVNEGLYAVTWHDYNGSFQRDTGVTVNEPIATTGSTAIGSMTPAQGVRSYHRAPAAASSHGCQLMYLYAGDQVRCHNDGNAPSAIAEFSFMRVS